MAIIREFFGMLPSGQEVYRYILTNAHGLRATFLTLGAVWQSMEVPDKDGRMADIVLGYDRLADYLRNDLYFGAVVGRNANRISGAEVVIGRKRYRLAANDGANNLHSGPDMYATRLWASEAVQYEHSSRVSFYLSSPDGDQGYPGNAVVRVIYSLTEEDSLVVDFRLICDKDTIANFTQHSYFNLAGHASGHVLGQLLTINSRQYTPTDAASIPTGEILPVAGTPMDFNAPKAIGRDIDADFLTLKNARGYDHNWVLDHKPGRLSLAARAKDPLSGRVMEVHTDQPGVQFYSGNYITEGTKGKNGALYGPRHGFCLETQNYPDACHRFNFPSPFVAAGDEYRTRTVFRFRVED